MAERTKANFFPISSTTLNCTSSAQPPVFSASV
jgi:hypothetical protein